ncbi:MAG: glycosyltransferase [Flavobacteriales bacterium]|nr:glycosyltransferase [Flavobacteriales bacterium]
MHVLFLPGWYPNRTHPTLGNFVQRHARAIATLHRVTVVHAVRDPAARGTELVTTTHGPLTEHILYSDRGPLGRLRATLALIGRLRNENAPFDLVHANILHAVAPLAWMVHRRWGLPFLVSENWTGYHLDAYRRLPLSTRTAMHWTADRAGMLCPVSEQLAGAMRRHGFQGPHRVVPNVVDTERFHAPKQHRPPPPTRFLHVSTLLDAHKNVSGLIRSFAAARRQVPAITLDIVGDGDRAPHERTAAGLGLGADAIRFEGPMEPASIADRMRNADVFVLPSNHENLPCVMLEAFATGLPVLATDVGGIPEHLSGERGVLIGRGDMAALEREMSAIAQGRYAFDPDAIRDYAVGHFSIGIVARAFDTIYHDLLQHSGPDVRVPSTRDTGHGE